MTFTCIATNPTSISPRKILGIFTTTRCRWDRLGRALKNKGCVILCVALPFTLKRYLKAKEEITETQIFHHAKIYLIFKKSS
jgi:hypothetical protein